MSTVTTIPTLEQSCALAELVRHGELTQEHRYLIARLLDEIGTSVRVTAEGEQRYPRDSAGSGSCRAAPGRRSAPSTSGYSAWCPRWPLSSGHGARGGPAGVIFLAGPPAVRHR